MTSAAPRTGPEVLTTFADSVAPRWPEAAAALRECAHDPVALAFLPPEPAWDLPHRLVAAARWLALAGKAEDFEEARDPAAAFRRVLVVHQDTVARFVQEQPVQTNVVQRSFALLPLFLLVARAADRLLRLVELGASAGLNLVWDRYGYRYQAGSWGSGALLLAGEERTAVPADLLRTPVQVSDRVGIDLNPVDAATPEGLRLLCSFHRAGPARERLHDAARELRSAPPSLVRGDYLELLPSLLADRPEDDLTVVYQTHSTIYLAEEERARLRGIIDEAASQGPLAWISTPTPEEHGERRGDYPLELAVWPDGERRIVARTDVHGSWLDWSPGLLPGFAG